MGATNAKGDSGKVRGDPGTFATSSISASSSSSLSPTAPSTSLVSLDGLPMEVLVRIFELADCFETAVAGCVLCRSVAPAASDDAVWRPLGNEQWLRLPGWDRSEGKSWKRMYLEWFRALERAGDDADLRDKELCIKVAFLGASGVGKSGFIKRYNDEDQMLGSYRATLGVDIALMLVELRRCILKLQCWDFAGSEYKGNMMRSNLRMTEGAVMMYDVTSRSSFGLVEQQLLKFREFMEEHPRVMLIGNKIDLGDSEREVSKEEGQAMAKKHGMLFAEVSNQTGQGIEEAVDMFAEAIAVDQEGKSIAARLVPQTPRPRKMPKPETLHKWQKNLVRRSRMEQENAVIRCLVQ